MRILVTGASGFIGSAVCKKFASAGHEVVGIDSNTNYYAPELKKLRVAQFLLPSGVEFQEMDLSQFEKLHDLICTFQPQVVINLAAQAGVRLPIEESSKYVDSNLVGFSNLLRSVAINKVPNFLYASSSSVYGNSSTPPYSEIEKNLVPTSFYGATKLANEILAPALVRSTQTKTRGMRFFTVYGPWGRPDMAYFRIIAAALTGNTFTLNGDGDIRRDFTYIGDVIESLARICLLKKFQYSTLNIGGGNDRTLLEVISIIENLSGAKLKISKAGRDSMDLLRTKADTNRLESSIGTIPQTSIEIGLKTTLDWAMRKDIFPKLDLWKI